MILLADGNRLLAIRFAFFDIGATPPRGFARAPGTRSSPPPSVSYGFMFSVVSEWCQKRSGGKLELSSLHGIRLICAD